MEAVLKLVIYLLIWFLIWMVMIIFDTRTNYGWLVCNVILVNILLDNSDPGLILPASIFAVAGAIINLKQDKIGSKKDKN